MPSNATTDCTQSILFDSVRTLSGKGMLMTRRFGTPWRELQYRHQKEAGADHIRRYFRTMRFLCTNKLALEPTDSSAPKSFGDLYRPESLF
jgi:hypothetical protein